MTTNTKKYMPWMMSEHRTAIKMWSEGAGSQEIADEIGRSVRAVDYYIRTNRDLFPRRRARRGLRKAEAMISIGICALERAELEAAAKMRNVSLSVIIRNALILSKRNGWPIESIDAMLTPVERKPKEPTVAKPKAKIPFAGASRYNP